jgi:hypothetical protein
MPAGSGVIPYVRVRTAIDKGDLRFLLDNARELPSIGLADALRICLLYRDQDEDRYDTAAIKWLMRFVAEAREVSLEEIRAAAAALDALPEQRQSAMEQLSALCVRHGLTH